MMNTDVANRTNQHKFTSGVSDSRDCSDVNNQLRLGTPNSAEFNPETIAINPMYVVNLNPGNPDKSINITRQSNSFRRIPPRETGHFYDDPPNSPENSAETLRLSETLGPLPPLPRRIKCPFS